MGLGKNMDTLEHRAFWASVNKASEIVRKWPLWKRNLKVTNYLKKGGER